MHNKGAVIANVDANGVDKGNLNINVGGNLTHEDIKDYDNSVTRGVGVSIGVNPSQDTGGVSGVSGSYADQKKEGITRATVGEGNITVGGVEDDGGINRNLSKAQEVTFDEGMDATVNVPIELITNPAEYIKQSPENIKNLPEHLAGQVKLVLNVTKDTMAAAKDTALRISSVFRGEVKTPSDRAAVDVKDAWVNSGKSEEEARTIVEQANLILSGQGACGGVSSLWNGWFIANAYAGGACAVSPEVQLTVAALATKQDASEAFKRGEDVLNAGGSLTEALKAVWGEDDGKQNPVGGSVAAAGGDSTKTVDDIIKDSEPRPENPGTKQYDTNGGFDQASKDFDGLKPSDVKDYGNGTRVGTLPDGRTVVVRPNSSGGEPTLEIQKKIGGKVIEKIKIRYND